MAEIKITTRDGVSKILEAKNGHSVMEVLRDANMGVDGTCGGVCACGTCHVYVTDGWMAKLPAQSGDESEMLEAISAVADVRPTSRLACQIRVSDEVDGLELEIGPMI